MIPAFCAACTAAAVFAAADPQLSLPAQLGISIPFVLALGLVGRWLMKRVEAAEAAKDELYTKVTDRWVPALQAVVTASNELLQAAAEYRAESAAMRSRERER